jgi:hypothetical protein
MYKILMGKSKASDDLGYVDRTILFKYGLFSPIWSRDSVVGIATVYGQSSSPVRAQHFSPLHVVQNGSGAHPNLL